MTPARRLLALAVAALILLMGCAMPSDAEPDPITLDDEYADLLEPAPPPTTTTPAESTLPRGLWFIADDLLSRESTQIEVSRADDLTAVLNRLTEGTRQQDHRSAIPGGVVFLGHRSDEGSRTVTVEMADAALFEIDGTELARAVAQIVFTATQPVFGYEAVRFEIDGDIRSVPTGSGSNSNEPVGQCDYERFDPDPSCPSTTTTTTDRDVTTTTDGG
ncbi:MAG: GerMN domain-containing protein [Acidimicrobiales bacterium]